MTGSGFMLALTALASSAMSQPSGPGTWAKAVVFDWDGGVARYLPEHAARAAVPYPALRPGHGDLVRPLASALAGASAPTAFEGPISITIGRFTSETGPGYQARAQMDIADVRPLMGDCTSAAPESAGETDDSAYVIVRFTCPNASEAVWARPFVAFTIARGSVTKVTINIGDLPNIQISDRQR